MSRVKKVTMQEIADKLGVSKFAVSKALSGKSGISTATREKIHKVASEFGYNNQKKSRDAKQHPPVDPDHKIVGILIPNIRSQNKESAYWGKILEGISINLEKRGIGTIIITDDSPQNFNLVIKPEGLMGVISVGLIAPEMLLELRNLSIPFVLVDHEDDLLASDSVFMNSFDSLRRLTNYLFDTGHTHIHFVGDIHYSRSFFDRWCGFKSVMDEKIKSYSYNSSLLQIKPTVDADNYNRLTAELELLSENSFPTAFVCANDQIALHVLNVLKELAVQVPDDCSITGFDNNEDIIKRFPELTTMIAEEAALGTKAVDLLLWRIDNPSMPYEKVLLQSQFIVRGSTQTFQK
ncbi:transcriptional regulator, LacI family [Paenibacillus sp. 1_12]|uniref:LacI family DNA-binding transcriptional regulator n=1 Tax=Paenibacillus sp. 1_12 TaxID=1566278 RepID=UPI0008E5F312|nr:LacI family DNA-binding transcriptional regulator [Paenibacillus sp. 1_12]SFK74962.1 transcriptional regulator, LacI family [Paenibacillus sp. 1_12]